MQIDCGVCALRSWRVGDEEALVRHANDPAVAQNLRDRFPHPYTMDNAEFWVRFAAEQRPEVNLAIAVDGEAVGGIGLMMLHDVERTGAEIGYWLGRSHWGRGIATAAVRAMTEHAFDAHPLTRVFALPFTRNPASLRVLEKAGYSMEGLLRRSAIKNGEILNQAMYAITDQDLDLRRR